METLDELRTRAEESLSSGKDDPDVAELSQEETKALIHELQVHQIELEMQNLELRRLHSELEEAHHQYTGLYEFAPVGYFTLDRRSIIQQVNIAGARLLATQKTFLINVPFSKFVHSDDSTIFYTHLKQVFETGNKLVCEVRLRKNGEEKFVRLESVGTRDHDGDVTACWTVVSDLTARRLAEQNLQVAEGCFRAICETTEDIVLVKDTTSKFIYANPAAERLFELPASKVIGRRWAQIWGPDFGEYERDLDERVLAGNVVEEEHSRVIGRAERIFLETRLPIRDGTGNVNSVLFIARDVSDRKLKGFSRRTSPTRYPSAAMRATIKVATIAAKKNSIILLLGESGSGKDYLAKYIHNQSNRADGPYFSLNCAALAPDLAESELFGHEKGAFTGALARKKGLLELAEGGTLLLNEVGELSLPLQSKLLTFLDTRKFTRIGAEKEISVNARLIAATNRSLEQEVEAGRFRADLFYRLNVFPITVPPLRERREDIPQIIEEIMQVIRKDLQTPDVSPFDESTIQALMNYHWPGNVRELRNVIERAVMLSGHEKITLQNLGISGGDSQDTEWSVATKFPSGQSLNDLTGELRRALINEALRRTGGHRREAATLLGISRYSLKHYMKALCITDDE
jgi:PAS domain S-box-containing protein